MVPRTSRDSQGLQYSYDSQVSRDMSNVASGAGLCPTESTVLHVFKLQAPSESILNHVGLSGDRVPQHLVVSWLISITFSLTRHLFFDSPFCGQNPVEYPLNLRR